MLCIVEAEYMLSYAMLYNDPIYGIATYLSANAAELSLLHQLCTLPCIV